MLVTWRVEENDACKRGGTKLTSVTVGADPAVQLSSDLLTDLKGLQVLMTG